MRIMMGLRREDNFEEQNQVCKKGIATGVLVKWEKANHFGDPWDECGKGGCGICVKNQRDEIGKEGLR
jgi:hypothetical protein